MWPSSSGYHLAQLATFINAPSSQVTALGFCLDASDYNGYIDEIILLEEALPFSPRLQAVEILFESEGKVDLLRAYIGPLLGLFYADMLRFQVALRSPPDDLIENIFVGAMTRRFSRPCRAIANNFYRIGMGQPDATFPAEQSAADRAAALQRLSSRSFPDNRSINLQF